MHAFIPTTHAYQYYISCPNRNSLALVKHDSSRRADYTLTSPPLFSKYKCKKPLCQSGFVPAAYLGFEGIDAVQVPLLQGHCLAVALDCLAEKLVGAVLVGELKGTLTPALEKFIQE